MKIPNSSQAGFTLVELLIVITIIGVLSTLVSLNYGTVRAKARDDRRQSDLAAIGLALEQYRVVNKLYPVQTSWVLTAALGPSLAPQFIATVPKDPALTKVGGLDYRYASSASGSLYALDAVLEETKIDQTLDPSIDPNNNSLPNFFRTGFYQYGYPGPALRIHYRLSSQ